MWIVWYSIETIMSDKIYVFLMGFLLGVLVVFVTILVFYGRLGGQAVISPLPNGL